MAYAVVSAPEIITATVTVAGILTAAGLGAYAAAWKFGDWAGIKEDTMTVKEALDWFQYYRGSVDGELHADIFEDAGTDFLSFAKGLSKYKKRAKAGGVLPLHFVQLGDMVDFWVGFTSHYVPQGSPKGGYLPGDPATLPVFGYENDADPDGSGYGRRLAEHWTRNCFGVTKQGKMVAEALELIFEGQEDRHLEGVATFLRGNHDTYLGTVRPRYPSPDAPGGVRTLNRKGHYLQDGLFMEHGHQWDGSNADRSPIVPLVDLLVGTPSPLGEFLTQAAFIRPRAIRRFEGLAQALEAELSDDPQKWGQRPTQIAGAADCYVDMGGAFYCYAMGHTHEACLTKVMVTTSAKDDAWRGRARDEAVENADTCVYFAAQGKGKRGFELVEPSASVEVKWERVLGLADFDWASLADPLTNPRSFDETPSSLRVELGGQAFGAHTFKSLPPGVYVARVYFGHTRADFVKESLGKLAVHGVSLEGDAKAAFRRTFTRVKSRLAEPLVLRWAFPPFGRASEGVVPEAWFGLFRPHEANVSWKIATGTSGVWTETVQEVATHAAIQFFAMPGGFDFAHPERTSMGRYDLSDDPRFVETLVQHPGAWEIRVFGDEMGNQVLGRVSFHVEA